MILSLEESHARVTRHVHITETSFSGIQFGITLLCLSSKIRWDNFALRYLTVQMLDVLYFSCSKAPHLRQTIKVGWTYKLPRGQKFRFTLSPLSVGFPQRRPRNLIKIPPFISSPGPIYTPPCVQPINNPFFAIHQVFALSNYTIVTANLRLHLFLFTLHNIK